MILQKYFSKTHTAQSAPIPGSKQVANSAGGYAWAVDDWVRLDRFLVLGSEGGTYYDNSPSIVTRLDYGKSSIIFRTERRRYLNPRNPIASGGSRKTPLYLGSGGRWQVQ